MTMYKIREFNYPVLWDIYRKQKVYLNSSNFTYILRFLRAITMHYHCIYDKPWEVYKKSWRSLNGIQQTSLKKLNPQKVVSYLGGGRYTIMHNMRILGACVPMKEVDWSDINKPIVNTKPIIKYSEHLPNKTGIAFYKIMYRIEFNNDDWNHYLTLMRPNIESKYKIKPEYELYIQKFWEKYSYREYKKTNQLIENKKGEYIENKTDSD